MNGATGMKGETSLRKVNPRPATTVTAYLSIGHLALIIKFIDRAVFPILKAPIAMTIATIISGESIEMRKRMNVECHGGTTMLIQGEWFALVSSLYVWIFVLLMTLMRL